ncbi:hypothetical protein ANN_24647 [Periplaneta americana]|uniref:Uncharacterized protein n=1 Tax=Periplaneta americana TaxID=6978 RepID=A0ABQ8S3U5_PERAM|nr:hypothetical protein ANN_24647 [Periplaneta americana]
MAGLCEGGNEPPGSLKVSGAPSVSSTFVFIRENMIMGGGMKFLAADMQIRAVDNRARSAEHYLQIRTISSQFTVLLAQSLEFTVSRTTDLQRQFTVLELRSLQLRSTALELRSLQLRSTALELRPSDADADADAHSSRTPVHKIGLLALAFSLTG